MNDSNLFIRMPKKLKKAIKQEAQKNFMTISGFVMQLIIKYFQEKKDNEKNI